MSESFELLRDHLWFHLTGRDAETAQKFYSVYKGESEVSDLNLKSLGESLGLWFVVRVTDPMENVLECFPETYAFIENDNTEFYMLCPVGTGRKDGLTHFTPENAEQVSEAKELELDIKVANGEGIQFAFRKPRFYPAEPEPPTPLKH